MPDSPLLNVLVVEDDDDDFVLVNDLVHDGVQARLERAHSVDEALQDVATHCYDAVLLDYRLGGRTGFDFLRAVKGCDTAAPVIFLTGQGDEDTAVRALKDGAVDYLSKGKLNAKSLASSLRYAVNLRHKDALLRAAALALRRSEIEYRMVFENANDSILIFDPGTESILEANPMACQMYGYTRQELLGRSLRELTIDVAQGGRAIAECLASGRLHNYETVHRSRDGTLLSLLANASVVEYRGRHAILTVARDVSERKAAEEEIFRLNRALKALGKCGQALLHAANEQDLLQEICDIVVQFGGYCIAWVGRAENDAAKTVRPVARAGRGCDYVDHARVTWADEARGHGPAGVAIRNRQPALFRDLGNDPRFVPWRDFASEYQFRSALALPLDCGDQVFGSLCIYSSEADAFEAAEVELLRELAGNVSFGLGSLHAWRQRALAVSELKEKESRLRNLMETANEGIWTIDADERTTFVNPKMAEMLGYTPEEMLGRPLLEFVAPPMLAEVRAEIGQRSARRRGRYTTPLLRKDGSEIVTDLCSSPILDANGDYIGALAMVSDITEQTRAQQALRESEERYRSLFHNALAGVFRATANGKLLEVNEACVRMLGYDSAAEMLQEQPSAHFADPAVFARHIRHLLREGKLVNVEAECRKKNGEPAWLLANVTIARDAAGNPAFIEGAVIDVTERRRLETQLLHSQKMDAVGQLAGGIAHDFNNLLMVISGYAELLGDTLQDEGLRKYVGEIVRAGERGATLTRQLLAFGRKQVMSPRLLDLNSFLGELHKVLPRMLGEDIKVEVRGGSGLWAVKADPMQLEQVVLNLAVNARDAMPKGGCLTLETANVNLDVEFAQAHAGICAGDYVMLAVSDTGCGIPAEVLPRIFEPFFTTKPRGKGTGLGLPTVYGIMRQSGGFVWVYSEVGKGTVFKVYLPRSEALRAGQPALSDAAAAQSGSETVLLVEDEDAVRGAAGEYLRLRGYQVLDAASGDEALRLSEKYQGKIDLLITDVIMPGLSGSEVAQQVMQRRPGIGVLYISGYTETTIGQHGVENTEAFLQKPFSLSSLAAKVREVLGPNAELQEPSAKH